MIWIFIKILLVFSIFTCNYGNCGYGVTVTAANVKPNISHGLTQTKDTKIEGTLKKRGSFKATDSFPNEENKATGTLEKISVKEMCRNLVDLNKLLEQTKTEANTCMNGNEFKSKFSVDEMGKIVQRKMSKVIQLEEINRDGLKILESELKKSIGEGKKRMDAELAKFDKEHEERIEKLTKVNADRVALIMKEFDRNKKELIEAYESEKRQTDKEEFEPEWKKIDQEYANFVNKISREMVKKVVAIEKEYDKIYEEAIDIMEELYAEYKKNSGKWTISLIKTKSQKEKSKQLTKLAAKMVFNEFRHEIGKQQERNGQVEEAPAHIEAQLDKLMRKVAKEKFLLKNSSGSQLGKAIKGGLVAISLKKRKRRRKRSSVGLEAVDLYNLFGIKRRRLNGISKGKLASGPILKDNIASFKNIWNEASGLPPPNSNDGKISWKVGYEEDGHLKDYWGSIGKEAYGYGSDTDSSSIFSSQSSDAGSSFSSLSSKSSSSSSLRSQSSFDSVGSSRISDFAEPQDDVLTMMEAGEETTNQFINTLTVAKISNTKLSHKMLQKFGELKNLDKQMKPKCAATKEVEKHYEELEEKKWKELVKPLTTLYTKRVKRFSEIKNEFEKKLEELEGERIQKLDGEYEYIDEKNKSKTLLPWATFVAKVGTEFTDKSESAVELQRQAELDINLKLRQLSEFEQKLDQIAKLEKDIGKIKNEMSNIKNKFGGGIKEQLKEKCPEESEELEFKDANSEFVNDSD